MLFLKKAKLEYKEVELPFVFGQIFEDYEACIYNFEICSEIDGKTVYMLSSYYYKVSDDEKYNNLLEQLKNYEGKTVLVKLKYKNEKFTDYEIDLNSLANCYQIPEIKEFELSSWGINDNTSLNDGE